MNDFLKWLKTGVVAVFATLSSWLGILAIPVLVLVITNIVDYGTGLCAAKYREQDINSYKSIRGIAKKVCMWLLVGVGGLMDWLILFAAEAANINFTFKFVVASVTAIWLIVNEIISILENMKDIGVALPPFLMKIATNIKSQTEKKADIATIEEQEEEENE